MTLMSLLIAGTLLSLERLCYLGIARAPHAFRRWCARPRVARLGEPIVIVQTLFLGFKVLQLSVFLGWCYAHGDGGWGLGHHDALALGVAVVAILAGQFLVWSVFYRLGRAGVFYGDRLGHDVPWCHSFPFSLLSHPQYVGAVLTIWGFFLATRFPHDDWFLLPALETALYLGGALLERAGTRGPLSVGGKVERPSGDRRTGRAAVRRRAGGGEGATTLSHDLGQ
jgi:protein-S-isoprenylcysteine O-methyltransferase Ste14